MVFFSPLRRLVEQKRLRTENKESECFIRLLILRRASSSGPKHRTSGTHCCCFNTVKPYHFILHKTASCSALPTYFPGVESPLSYSSTYSQYLCIFWGKKTLCAAICCAVWITTWHTRLDNRITAWRNIYLCVSLRAITIHQGSFFVRGVNESSTWNTHLWWNPTLMKAGTCKCCRYFIWTACVFVRRWRCERNTTGCS